MKRQLLAVALLSSALVVGYALPPDMQADQYLLAAKACIDKGEYHEAADYFRKILKLKVSVPDQFYFHYGRTLKEVRRFPEAKVQVLRYLELAGRGGQHYMEALQLLTGIEDQLALRRIPVMMTRCYPDGTLVGHTEYTCDAQGRLTEIREFTHDSETKRSKLWNVSQCEPRDTPPTMGFYGYFGFGDVRPEYHARVVENVFIGKDSESKTVYTYNDHGDLLSETSGNKEGSYRIGHYRNHVYDRNNRLVAVTRDVETNRYADGKSRKYTETLRYKYSGSLRLPTGSVCSHDAQGRVSSFSYPFYRGGTARVELTYDRSGRIVAFSQKYPDRKRTVTRLAYDRNGRIVEKREGDRVVIKAAYDEEGNLTELTKTTRNPNRVDTADYRLLYTYRTIKVLSE